MAQPGAAGHMELAAATAGVANCAMEGAPPIPQQVVAFG